MIPPKLRQFIEGPLYSYGKKDGASCPLTDLYSVFQLASVAGLLFLSPKFCQLKGMICGWLQHHSDSHLYWILKQTYFCLQRTYSMHENKSCCRLWLHIVKYEICVLQRPTSHLFYSTQMFFFLYHPFQTKNTILKFSVYYGKILTTFIYIK